MNRLLKRTAVALTMMMAVICASAQQYGSLEWALGQTMGMIQNATRSHHYMAEDGSGIIIDPITTCILYCERGKRSSVLYYETTVNGCKAYVSPYRNITARQVTQNGQSCLAVSYDNRSDYKVFYYLGQDRTVDSHLKNPNTPLKEIFATCEKQYYNAVNAAQGGYSGGYNSSSSNYNSGSSGSSSSKSSGANVANRMSYQRAYDGYVDMLNSMKNRTYPYQNGFNTNEMRNIQSKMSALRKEWDSMHPDMPINSSSMEYWNGY